MLASIIECVYTCEKHFSSSLTKDFDYVVPDVKYVVAVGSRRLSCEYVVTTHYIHTHF